MKEESKRYSIELTEKQAKLLSFACDQYARLIQGQDGSYQDLFEAAWEKRCKKAVGGHGMDKQWDGGWYTMREHAEKLCRIIKKRFWGLGWGSLNGIRYDDTADILFDIHRVLRHQFYKDRGDTSFATVDSENPTSSVGSEPLIKIKKDMSMSQWAEQECRIACKRENPNFDFDDEKAWDYGCSCYKSALKAYKSLCEDGHSGGSFGFTKNILIRLMDGQPLTPITDEDFPKMEYDPDNEWLKEMNLRSDAQCPRMSSLFRYEHLDGRVTYHDNDRAYYINIENPSDTYSSWTGFLDEMFPITMPYTPQKGKYKIYAQSFLVDRKHGDFDTRGIIYVETPDGKRVDIDIYETEGDDGKWKRITREEYDYLLTQRIDKLRNKVANHLLWTLVSNSGGDAEIEIKEKGWKALSEDYRRQTEEELQQMCTFFDKAENWQYNTFHVHQALCKGETEEFKDIPELMKIADFLKKQKEVIIAKEKEASK